MRELDLCLPDSAKASRRQLKSVTEGGEPPVDRATAMRRQDTNLTRHLERGWYHTYILQQHTTAESIARRENQGH